MAEVQVIIDKYKPDIILGNELWLNSDILNSEVFPANFTVYRKDSLLETLMLRILTGLTWIPT